MMKQKSVRFFLIILSILSINFVTIIAHSKRPIRGFYEVPVSNELKPYAIYPIKFKADTYETNPDEIVFPLPAELVGEEFYVKMAKVEDSENLWAGPNVEGSCSIINREFKCKVKFNNLIINQSQVEQVIKNTYQNQSEVGGRLQVAQLFGTEPIGYITYRLRGKKEN